MALREDLQALKIADTPADKYDFAKAEQFIMQADAEVARLTGVAGAGKTASMVKADRDEIFAVYTQKKSEREQQLAEQQKAMQAEEARLKAQEQARIAQQKKDAESLSLLGQKDLTGVAKTYGTANLDAALEIKRQREDNARKQAQSEKIDAMSLRIARGQRGRKGVATGTGGGRGFFERYFQ